MPKQILKVIPKPAPMTRTILEVEGDTNIHFRSGGDIDLVCGGCGENLAEKMNAGQVEYIVLKCNACGSYNDVP